MAGNRRFRIDSDHFSIENGWLFLNGPSIRINSITSFTIVRNIDDVSREPAARGTYYQAEMHKRRWFRNAEFIFSIAMSLLYAHQAHSHYLFYMNKKIEMVKEYLINKGGLVLVASIIPTLIAMIFLYFLPIVVVFFASRWVALRLERLLYGPIPKYVHKNIYELALDTNSGMEFFLLSSQGDYLYRVKQAIEEAIASRSSSTVYHFNISAGTIEKFDANVNNVTNSPGAAVIGGSASHVNQTTNVTIQGIQEVAQLAALVEQVNAPNKAYMKECLDIVRDHLAGHAPKPQAKAAWERFVENVGSLAKAGNEVWRLVARIGVLIG